MQGGFTWMLLVLTVTSCSVSKDSQRTTARLLQKGKLKDDTSWVYNLPYAAGTSRLVIQGYFSRFSHRNRAAIDFKMKKGTSVFAARGGRVIRVQKENNKGGWNKKFRPFANYLVIEHNDSTRAGYWHLQQHGVLVNVGDSIYTGQHIGFSGSTGYSATPHLHFMVWKNTGGKWIQIPTRFQTRKGVSYLRPLRWYKRS